MLSVILLSLLVILLSILGVIRHMTCGKNLNCLLNVSLIYETLWTAVKSGFLISMLRKLNWCRLTGLITMVLLMWEWMGLFLMKNQLLTLFRGGGEGGAESPTITSVSPVTSTNLGSSPKSFWLLVLTLLPHWCKVSRFYLVPVPNYWTWTKTTPQKICFFWSNPYEIEVTIMSLLEMLELPNFGHMNTSTI